MANSKVYESLEFRVRPKLSNAEKTTVYTYVRWWIMHLAVGAEDWLGGGLAVEAEETKDTSMSSYLGIET